MVTLRRPPQYTRPGPPLEPYQVILRPLITEKGTHLAHPPERPDPKDPTRNRPRRPAYTFEVHPLATKTEIKNAIETLFNVKVYDVRTQNRRGKSRRFKLKTGRMRNWKKAIVALHADYRIESL
ncbi:MAG: 50S ribosomal protein L23 [Isosphaeraceae bacterium]|jgi:large subunit ribosomal protein L23|nr:MAG: 50S ribosomal protein L23 [Isosphaeraceae bacterium]